MTDDLVLESFRDPCMFVSNSRVGLEAVTYQTGPINPIYIYIYIGISRTVVKTDTYVKQPTCIPLAYYSQSHIHKKMEIVHAYTKASAI